MKKIFGITLAAVLLGLLVSCGGAMSSNPLCGKWEDTAAGIMQYEFNGDASYKLIPVKTVSNTYIKGTWSTEGSTLTLKTTKLATLGFEVDDPVPSTTTYQYSVSGNTATIGSINFKKI